MAKRNEPGLIRYTFGLHGEGAKGLLNQRVLLPAVAILALLVTLGIALLDRPVASLKVAVSHTAASRLLANNQTGTFFNAWVNNRSQKATTYNLMARNKESGQPFALKGQTKAELAAGENRRLDFVLLTPTHKSLTVEFVLRNNEGLELSVAEAYIGKTEKE
jgi:hypothetical protein